MSANKKHAPKQVPDLSSLAIGHQSPSGSGEDREEALRVFQSNLLSLISHELRTPLTGILNALGLLNEGQQEDPDFSSAELVQMALRNAHALNHSLSSLLDLAAIESGTFHLRLKEGDLYRMCARVARTFVDRMEAQELKMSFSYEKNDGKVKKLKGWDLDQIPESIPLLMDPKKIARSLELCLDLIRNRANPGSSVDIHLWPRHVRFSFQLKEVAEHDSIKEWEESWSEALAGVQSGVFNPSSMFGSSLHSEKNFLTRSREGLGSEFLLIHEIIRRHRGQFHQTRKGHQVELQLELPALSSYESLRSVLISRIYETTTELGSVAIALLAPPKVKGKTLEVAEFRQQVKDCLFRSSDAVYGLDDASVVALVLNDCKKEDAAPLLSRIESSLGVELSYGVVTCPEEATDPDLILKMAQSRLENKS